MMDANAACPDCDKLLSESSSERGDYFCPNCTKPVSADDVRHYCRECGEVEVSKKGWKCSDCRNDFSTEESETEGEHMWGTDGDDDLGWYAARGCPGCGMMLISFNFMPRPLHDGDGNYYVGHSCPHCGEVLERTQPAGDEELADHAKETAVLDDDPPDDLSELGTFEL